MEYLYLPVAPPHFYLGKLDGPTPLTWMDPRTRAWGDDYFPNILISYVYWRGARFNFMPDSLVFGDSGGHTVMTSDISVGPREAIRWQVNNTNIGAILDRPPFADNVSGHGAGWRKGLRYTKRNTELALPIYEKARHAGTDFRWWGVIQGRTWREMEAWWRAISDIYPFTDDGEGWAFNALGASRLTPLAHSLGFLQKKGVTHAHSFGTAGWEEVIVLMCYGARAGLERITFDSATSVHYARNRVLMVPSYHEFKYDRLEEREREEKDLPATRYMMEKCDCRSCACLREDYPNGPPREGSYISIRMSFHNLFMLRRVFDNIYRASRDDPDYLLSEFFEEAWHLDDAFAGVAPSVPVGEPRSLLNWT